MFWGIYFYDKALLFHAREFANIPYWHVHATVSVQRFYYFPFQHSLVTITAFFDILFSRPSPVPFLYTLLSGASFYLGYVV